MEALTLPSPTKGWKADTGFLGRWILLGAGAGAISGALIGGVGGRIAMLVLRLTSSDRLRGATTDDGFEIGVITFATVQLIILTGIIGAVGGPRPMPGGGAGSPVGRNEMILLIAASASSAAIKPFPLRSLKTS